MNERFPGIWARLLTSENTWTPLDPLPYQRPPARGRDDTQRQGSTWHWAPVLDWGARDSLHGPGTPRGLPARPAHGPGHTEGTGGRHNTRPRSSDVPPHPRDYSPNQLQKSQGCHDLHPALSLGDTSPLNTATVLGGSPNEPARRDHTEQPTWRESEASQPRPVPATDT